MRPATLADEAGIATLAAKAGGLGTWGHEARTGPDHPDRRRYVVEDGGQLVGYGAIWRRHDSIFGLDALVDPAARRRGLGRQIVDQLFEDLAALEAHAVESRIDADHLAALNFMIRRGFFELNRLERVRLDLTQMENGTVRAAPAGVDIVPLAEAGDEAHREMLRAMLGAAFHERRIKLLEPFYETPLEQLAELPDAIPEGSHVARARDAVVGFTGLKRTDEPGVLRAFLTAVAPTHRHGGVATALKRRAISWAKKSGARAIISNSPNRDMQDLNELLGFKRVAVSEIRLGRRV